MNIENSLRLKGNSSIYSRFRYMAALDAEQLSYLIPNQDNASDAGLLDVPGTYDYLLEKSKHLAQEYGAFRDFYASLAFNDGHDCRYFSFHDRRNYSRCTSPWISQKLDGFADSSRFFREVQIGLARADLLWCLTCGGTWKIGTTDPQFKDRLFKFGCGKRHEVRRDGPCHHFIFRDQFRDQYLELHQIIVEHHCKFLLPFEGERDPGDIHSLDARLLGTIKRKDAWL